MSATTTSRTSSRIGEVVAAWSNIRQLIRGGQDGTVVPVVIPKDRRRLGWLVLVMLAVWLAGVATFTSVGALAGVATHLAVLLAPRRRAVALARRDRRDRAGHDRHPDPLRRHHRHAQPGTPLPLVALGRGRLRRRHLDRDRLHGAGRGHADPGERAPQVHRVLPQVPDRRPGRVRSHDRCRQLRHGALQRRAGRHPPTQPAGAHRAGLRPARQRRRRHAGDPQPPARALRGAHHRRQHPGRGAAGPVPAAPGHPRARRQGADGLRTRVGADPQAPDRRAPHGHRAGQEGTRRTPDRGQGRPQRGPPGRRPDARGAGDRGAAGALGHRGRAGAPR